MNLEERFLRGRGLKEYELQTMHYGRVPCGRRLFKGDGQSIEGDADIKATLTPSGLLEIEIPLHVTFEAFGAINPFNNGVASIETAHGRRLLDLKGWKNGSPVQIQKNVSLHFSDARPPAVVQATSEVRVIDETYPSTYLVRETIHADKPFQIFLICQ